MTHLRTRRHNPAQGVASCVYVLNECDYATYGVVTSRTSNVRANPSRLGIAHAGLGGHVKVHLERANLTDGVLVMHLVQGNKVRAAYDPHQIEEAAALAWICLREPRLVRDGFHVLHATP